MKRLLALALLTGCAAPVVTERAALRDTTNTVTLTNVVTVFETNHIFVQHLYTNGIIEVGHPDLPPLKPQPMPAHLPPQ